jgi:ribonucleotide reductase alpha subunit
MALGLPYDSAGGRAWAAAITALMTGHAYETSARTAARVGPFAGYTENAEHMLRVLDMHRQAAAHIDEELVRPTCCRLPRRRGTTPSSSASATASATARRRCWPPPAPSA